MTRWFYTDPLAAAWMAKHFGMRFNVSFAATGQFNEVKLPAIESHIGLGHLQIDGNFQIHPDSLYLLDRDVGDLITTYNWGDGVARLITNETRLMFSRGLADVRIIQRNGIPFMWPQEGA